VSYPGHAGDSGAPGSDGAARLADPPERPDPTESPELPEPSDPRDRPHAELDDFELLGLVRAGEDTAFAELFSRHARAVRGYALRHAANPAEAEDIAAEAFFRVLQAVRHGAGPADNVRGYLLTVVRRLAAEWRTRQRDVPTADEELSRWVPPGGDQTAGRAEAHLIATAFTSLPQRWRTVLWHVDVQGQRPAVVARQFGLSPNATAALARRAREGLRAAYLQAHVSPAAGANGCRSVVDRLGAYTAGNLRAAESRRIATHLAGCPDCRALHDELVDVCVGLRRHAVMLVPPALGGLGLFARRLFAGHVGPTTGKLAAAGARVKLVAAAASMGLAGGLGVLAGPMLGHAHLAADHGTEPILQVRPVAPRPGSDRIALPTDSGSPLLATGAISASSSPVGPTGLPLARPASGGSRQISGPPASRPGTTVGGSAPVGPVTGADQNGPDRAPLGQQSGPGDPAGVSRTTAPSVTQTDTTAPSLQSEHDSVNPEVTTTESTTPTPWTTVWTTDGTTIWEKVWP
jgi:RNA polymerase sigma factor (sigma-70 family)